MSFWPLSFEKRSCTVSKFSMAQMKITAMGTPMAMERTSPRLFPFSGFAVVFFPPDGGGGGVFARGGFPFEVPAEGEVPDAFPCCSIDADEGVEDAFPCCSLDDEEGVEDALGERVFS